MFGYPCAFLNGNMFCGLYREHFILRLPGPVRVKFLAQPGATVFEPMPGRPMKEYVVVPSPVLASDSAIRVWLREARAYVAGMPPKANAKAKAKAPRAAKPARGEPAKRRPATRRAPDAKRSAGPETAASRAGKTGSRARAKGGTKAAAGAVKKKPTKAGSVSRHRGSGEGARRPRRRARRPR
jgi:hypothetical protein